MRLKLYELNSAKIIDFATKMVKNDAELHKNREFIGLIIAPMALLEFGEVFYIVTKNMDPEDGEQRWRFAGIDAGVALPIFVTFETDGQLKWDPTPAFKFATTPRELIDVYSRPVPLSWMDDKAHKNWVSHLYSLDKK